MDLLSECIKECFDFSFGNDSSPKEESGMFSVYQKTLPDGFEYYYPIQVSWKLTSECNLRCKHCFYINSEYTNFDSSKDLSFDEIMYIAKILAEDLNIISVTLTGGEVLLSPHIIPLINYLKSKNLCIALLTNGTLLNENIVLTLSQLLNPKVDLIQVSLDGATAKTHDAIRGVGSFDKTLNGIDLLAKHNIPTYIATTVTSANIFELDKYINLCERYNVKQLNLNRYKVFSEEQAYLLPDTDNLFLNFAKLIRTNKHTKIKRNFFQAYDFLKYEYGKFLFDSLQPKATCSKNKRCHNHNRFHLSASGKVFLCPSAESLGLCLGDLKKESFDKIWQRRLTHPMFMKRTVDDTICGKCSYQHWCHCGCMALSYYNSGHINTPSQECEYRKILEGN